MLQNREVSDSDLSNLLEEKKEIQLDDKITIAKDIFANSSSREYLINLNRITQGKIGNQALVGGGIGLVNLQERRQAQKAEVKQ